MSIEILSLVGSEAAPQVCHGVRRLRGSSHPQEIRHQAASQEEERTARSRSAYRISMAIQVSIVRIYSPISHFYAAHIALGAAPASTTEQPKKGPSKTFFWNTHCVCCGLLVCTSSGTNVKHFWPTVDLEPAVALIPHAQENCIASS